MENQDESYDGSYDTYCPQCEAPTQLVAPNLELVVGTDGTRGLQGPCPTCGTITTFMLSESPKD